MAGDIPDLVFTGPWFLDVLFMTCVAGYSMSELEQDFQDSKIQIQEQCEIFEDYMTTGSTHDKYRDRLSEIYETKRMKTNSI
jgi:hypothetical protein